MSDFPHIPATPISIKRRKPVYGVGINDAEYMTAPKIKGKQIRCPFYQAWKNMLMRCYNEKYQARQPQYKGCQVDKAWLRFTVFRKWMIDQDWEGKHLDKDILSGSNKIYSPETCMFVSARINAFFVEGRKGNHQKGVSFDKIRKLYKAEIAIGGRVSKFIGRYDSAEKAHKAWKMAKSKYTLELSREQDDNRVKQALIDYSNKLILSC